jgi:hypothetical protein
MALAPLCVACFLGPSWDLVGEFHFVKKIGPAAGHRFDFANVVNLQSNYLMSAVVLFIAS